ncbi:MAG: sensor domain-containing diguanylate cyclase [Deltaproteobacteria bacterium]|nr:sensor domain-containing diguanylate cyclase [Candidatus Anaeroferrophillacea bacterium]
MNPPVRPPLDEAFFRRFAEHSYTWETWRTPDGAYTYVSPACERICGYPPEEFYRDPKIMTRIVRPDHLARWHHHRHQLLGSGEHEYLDIRIVTTDGRERWISHICRPVKDEAGRFIGLRSSNIDITGRKQIEVALAQAAQRDPLTGILNRRAIYERLQEEFIRFQRSGRAFSVIMADLDHFKAVNDTYGHKTGDAVLCHAVELMAAAVRGQDAVSRWGGEEFLILLPETVHRGGMHVAEKIRRRFIANPHRTPDGDLPVTISLGVCTIGDGMSLDSCLKEADDRLYEAKRQGRNRVCGRDTAMDDPECPPGG